MASGISPDVLEKIIEETASVDPELKKEYDTPSLLPRARPAPGFFRGMGKRRRGGARCAEGSRQRQAVRLLVLAAAATGVGYGAPLGTAAIQNGLAILSSNATCSIGAGASTFKLTACAKYGELLIAMNRLATDVSMSSVLQGALTFAAGMSVAGIAGKVKGIAASIYGGSKDALELIVDQVCTTLFDESGNFISPPAAAPAPGAAAAAAPASGDVTMGGSLPEISFTAPGAKPFGGRKSRRSKRTLKKKRVAKKSTRKLSFRY